MNIAIIDLDTVLLNNITNTNHNFQLISKIERKTKLDEISLLIANEVKHYDVILINIDAEFEKENRHKHKGIELIFWLRLKYNIGKPIILTSFRKITHILKDYPLYTILNAERIFFLDILSGFDVLDTSDVLNLAPLSREEIRKYYTQHVKNILDISLIRHQEANWFAIKTLWDINKIKNGKSIENDYPKFVRKNLNSFNNFIASWLHPVPNLRLSELIENVKLERIIKNQELLKQKEKITLIPEKISFNIEIIELYKQDIEEKEEWIISLKNQEQREGISKIEKEIKSINKEIESLTIENTNLESQIVEIDKKKNPDVSEISIINNLLNDLGIKKTQKRNLNVDILHIDDLAGQGWSELFRKILKGSSIDLVDFSNLATYPSHKEKIDGLWELIKDKIQNKNYQAIILDLRLFSDDNSSIDINDISGIIILEKIKEIYAGIPVLITSASNKIWTYKTCLSKGADAYWIKEGVDNNYDIKDSIRSYERLIKIIDSFKNREYTCLREMKDALKVIEDDNKIKWWNKKDWAVKEALIKGENYRINRFTKVSNEGVALLYKQTVNLYADFLRKKNILKSLTLKDQNFYYSSIITHLGKNLEIFHPYDRKNNITSRHLASLRGDEIAEKIYRLRNTSSHYKGFVNTNKFIQFIGIFNDYIINETVTISNKVIEKSKERDKNQSKKLKQQLKNYNPSEKQKEDKRIKPRIVKDDDLSILKSTKKPLEKSVKVEKVIQKQKKETVIAKTDEKKNTLEAPSNKTVSQIEKEQVKKAIDKLSFFKRVVGWINKLFN